MAYNRTFWKDHVTDQEGQVIQQGTLLDQEHFNNLEEGVSDAHLTVAALVNAILLDRRRLDDLETQTYQEIKTITLSNSAKFPFNNSVQTVTLEHNRDNLSYVVEIISVTPTGGPAGAIEITERQENGFKIAFTGSATSVTVVCAVIGGYDK